MKPTDKAILKEGGKVRLLSIPTIRDRVVQGALKLIQEPIFEADFGRSFSLWKIVSQNVALFRPCFKTMLLPKLLSFNKLRPSDEFLSKPGVPSCEYTVGAGSACRVHEGSRGPGDDRSHESGAPGNVPSASRSSVRRF